MTSKDSLEVIAPILMGYNTIFFLMYLYMQCKTKIDNRILDALCYYAIGISTGVCLAMWVRF